MAEKAATDYPTPPPAPNDSPDRGHTMSEWRTIPHLFLSGRPDPALCLLCGWTVGADIHEIES